MIVYWITVLASCAYVGARGGPSERLCVGAVAIASLVTVALVSPFARRFHSMEWGVFGVDFCLLLVLILIVSRSRRYWPLWATGFQVVALISNTAILSPVSPRAYALAQGFWAYAILGSVIAGTWSRTLR
jgi:hypothetical protein